MEATSNQKDKTIRFLKSIFNNDALNESIEFVESIKCSSIDSSLALFERHSGNETAKACIKNDLEDDLFDLIAFAFCKGVAFAESKKSV